MGLKKNALYLTFDDGPHPEITEQVLDRLKDYGAKATFFCIGENVIKYPATYQRILAEGHAVGNHTFNHLNGWKTIDQLYIENAQKASEVIHSSLFRPPYGKIKISQRRKLMYGQNKMKIIMWSVLSGDFDLKLTPERCCKYVIRSARPGSIIVFHDSEKAAERMLYSLPKVLEHFTGLGYRFDRIEEGAV